MSNVVAMPPRPVNAPGGFESGHLLVRPELFEGYVIVASFYERPHNGFLHGHLVMFHMHSRTAGAPAVIPEHAPVFGIGHVEYDDDAEDVATRRLAEHVTYAQAVEFLANAMLRAIA